MNFEKLLKECCAGSEIGWKQFIEQFHPLISSVINRVCRDDSEDTAQLVYEKLIKDDYRLLVEFNGCYTQFILYLKNLAYNTALNTLKKVSRISSHHVDAEFDEIFSNADTLRFRSGEWRNADDENIDSLRAAIDKLECKYREVIVYIIKGYKNREIAEILGLPINTVLTRSNRGKEILKKLLKNEINMVN